MARIIWKHGGLMPSNRVDAMIREIPNQTQKLAKRMGDTFFDSVLNLTPVDTGLMKKSWVKEYTQSGNTNSAKVYNTARNERTGFPYPIALNYGFHHYYFGTYLGFKAGLYFKEQAEADAVRKADGYINDLIRGVLRKW